MTIRCLSEQEQSMIVRALEDKVFKEATIALDLHLPPLVSNQFERLKDSIRAGKLCLIEIEGKERQ